jgi:hypothetical protein
MKHYQLKHTAKGSYLYLVDGDLKTAVDGTRSAGGNYCKVKTQNSLRKFGEKMAKSNGVSFTEKTV